MLTHHLIAPLVWNGWGWGDKDNICCSPSKSGPCFRVLIFLLLLFEIKIFCNRVFVSAHGSVSLLITLSHTHWRPLFQSNVGKRELGKNPQRPQAYFSIIAHSERTFTEILISPLMGGKEFVKNAKTMESNATPRKKQSRPKQCKIVRQLEKPSGWEARGLLLKPNRLMHRHKPITRPSVTVHQRKRLFNIIQKCNKVLHRSIGKQWHN